MTPLVSIIVTSYNYARFLRPCIDSALAQTHPNCETIVIDDGSKDDSPDIIHSYGSRIRATLKPNEGPASSWNLGFTQSHGEFVLFLDSDDVLSPTAVEVAMKSFDAPDAVRVQWPLWQINATGDRTGGFIPGTQVDEGHLRDALLKNGPASYMSAPTSGNLWRRSFLEKVLPVPPQFKLMCDAYLMTMSPLHGAIRALKEPQGYYRTHGHNDYHSMTFLPRLERDVKAFEYRCELLREHCRQTGAACDESAWARDSYFYRLRHVARRVQALVPAGASFLMVDNGSWAMDQSLGRTPLPFLEKDGYYYGAPPDDDTAIAELQRMRAAGATFIVFGWPAFWWLDHYPRFAAHLRDHARELERGDDLIAFQLV